MKLSVIAACCAALSLGACANPVALVEGVKAINDGCDRDIKATVTFATPMPPSGTIEFIKRCRAAPSAAPETAEAAAAQSAP